MSEAKTKQVLTQMEYLAREVGTTEDSLSCLRDKLAAVLRQPEPTASCEERAEEVIVPLAADLRGIGQCAYRTRMMIRDIIDRIEL